MCSIKLVAHRGYQKLYPENTLLAYRQAIQAGAHFIETDVQLSADRQPVLYHDRKLKRCTGLKGRVHDHSLQQLFLATNHEPGRLGDRFNGQSIEPLTDLVTLIKAHPQLHAFIEIKSITIDFHGIDTSYHCIADALAPVIEQCTLISFHSAFMSYARLSGWPSIGIALRQWEDLQRSEVVAMSPDFIFVDIKELPASTNFADIDARLVVYEIDNPDLARSLQQRGINYIETFAIGEMQQALQQ